MALPQVPGLIEWLLPRVLAPQWPMLLELRERVSRGARTSPRRPIAEDGAHCAGLYRDNGARNGCSAPQRTDSG